MSYINKPFEELNVMDDFLMNAIAANAEVGEDFCRSLLSVLLGRSIGKIKVVAQYTLPALSTYMTWSLTFSEICICPDATVFIRQK